MPTSRRRTPALFRPRAHRLAALAAVLTLAACGGGSASDETDAPADAGAAGSASAGALAVRSKSAAPRAASTWIHCAKQWQSCVFSGTRAVRYGTTSNYFTRVFTDAVACTNAVFGDPAAGAAKSCAYEADPASGPNPPILVNVSNSARAGDVVSVQGENFGDSPQVLLSGSATPLAIVNRVGTNWLGVQLPADASGALVLKVVGASGTSAGAKLNAAIPHHLDALQLVPGGAFRVFGRNLLMPGATPSVRIDGKPAAINLAASNEHLLVAKAPSGIGATSAAAITVDNGNGSGPAPLDRQIAVVVGASGDPFALGVGWGAGFAGIAGRSVAAATDSRLAVKAACNGQQDDAPALQAAIDLAASTGGAVVRLPAGTCRLGVGLSLKTGVVLEGAAKDATVLRYETDYPVAATGLDLIGIRNLTLANAGSATEGPLLKNNTRLVVQNVKVDLGTSHQMYLSGNRNAVLMGSDFVQSGSVSEQGPYVINDSSGLVFDANTTRWVNGASSFGGVHDSFIRGSRFTRDGAFQNNAGAVHSLTLDFAYRVAVVGNTFDVANGPIRNKTRNDGETILTEGGGAARTENLGSVASASAITLSDPANRINVDPFGTGSIPPNYGVAIVAGKGVGQTRRVVGYAAPTLTVDAPWSVVPDATSRYATFVWGLEKALIKGNVLAQNPRGIWLYHTAVHDVAVVGNSISEGGGIYLRSYQNLATKQFMPIYNVTVAGNTVSNATGNWMSYVNSVFVNADAKAFGVATIGVEMRDNTLTANQPNVSSQTEEYANIEGFMNMMRVETYSTYEDMALPRQLGTVFQRNGCNHCDVAFRLGTGAGGTTIVESRQLDSKQLVDDWATTSSPLKSTDTVVR